MRSFCANCGAPVEEGAAFCGSCGAPVQNAVEPMQPAVPVEPPVAPVESQPSAPAESAAPAQAPVYPVYQQPVYVQPVSPLKGSNGVGVASFVMSMVSLVATIAVIAIISSIMDSVSSFYFSFSELQTLCTSGIVCHEKVMLPPATPMHRANKQIHCLLYRFTSRKSSNYAGKIVSLQENLCKAYKALTTCSRNDRIIMSWKRNSFSVFNLIDTRV